jgi:Reverse transcriptase (RNA-dependent DNA polymerase)
MIDRKVFRPVRRSVLTEQERRSTIRSSMFLKAKYHPDETFDKLKARLVAGGDQQDNSLYTDLSSATVSTSAVFTLAAEAAHEGRHVAVVDIGGAFLNADMGKDLPIHMRLDKTMTEFLTTLDPTYRSHVDDRGGVTVRLQKALYGCVESSGLRYENLRATMESIGYKRNEMDVCLFNKMNSKGVQCTVCVHVDDLLIMSKSKSMINELTDGLTKRYGEISLKHGYGVRFHSYRSGQGGNVRVQRRPAKEFRYNRYSTYTRYGRVVRSQGHGTPSARRSASVVPQVRGDDPVPGQACEAGAPHSCILPKNQV